MRSTTAIFGLFIVGLMIFVAYNLAIAIIDTTQAEDRCREMGGMNWDAGYHCLLKDFTIVSIKK